MRRIVQLGLALLMLAGSSALAQGGMYAGGGVNLGYVSGGGCVAGECIGGISFGVKGQFGLNDLFMEDLGVRADLTLGFTSGITFFQVGANAIYDIPVGDMALAPYVGGGLRLGYASLSSTLTGFTVGGFLAGAGILGGASFPISQDLTAFGEVNLDFSSLAFLPSLTLGVNFGL